MSFQNQPYQVIAAHIMIRTSFRPLTFVMQRIRQLRRAVALVMQRDYQIPPQNITVLVAGTSFGGLPPQTAIMLYPDEFHAGICSGYNGSLRGPANEQDSLTYATAALGHANTGAGYGLRDTFENAFYCQLEGVNYESMSFVNRLRHPSLIRRPFHFYLGRRGSRHHR